MGGRLCFDVGELDGWQVIPFFKGIARSGKSTLITKVFKKFYENEEVGTLSNNIEKKFGLSAIKDAFMFIAPEVKGDLALEQAEFQSMVSGEDVSVAVKNKTAVSIEWNVPGVLGGNEVPNWKDNSGSVLRRILPWNFSKQVRDADPQLDEKLNRELPIILLKCVKAYLDYSNKYRDKDIWNVVPEYFKKIQKQVAMVAEYPPQLPGKYKHSLREGALRASNVVHSGVQSTLSSKQFGQAQVQPRLLRRPFQLEGY
jgi:phage/plasmid-associated DNA primase